MKRLEFSRKTRRLIIQRADGKCEACKASLKTGEGEVDHILPAVLGGSAEISNAQVLCRVCHAAKTTGDIRRTRKADRQRDKASGATRPKQSIKSRNDLSQRKAQAGTKLPVPKPKRLYAAQEE